MAVARALRAVMPKQQDEIKEIAAGLDGAIFSNSALDTATQTADVATVDQLRSTALGQGDPPPNDDARELALSKLQAMARAAEIPSLDTAAKALTGVTALLTGLFVGIGFQTGDFVRMIRDFWGQGFTFLLLASLAILLGTFAVVINAYRSPRNLWAERIAVYFGIVCATAAFGLAAWGISQGASAGPTRPTISASFNTTSTSPVLDVSASSTDVPRSEDLTATVWGNGPNGWAVLSNVVTGPTSDGAATASITVDNVATYSEIEATAALSSANAPIPSAPPSSCPIDTSCDVLVGSGTSP